MYNFIPQIKTAIFLMIVGFLLSSITAVFIMVSSAGLNDITSAQIGLLIGELFLPIPVYVWARNFQTNVQTLFRLNPVSFKSVITSVPIAIGLTIIIDELDRIAQMLVSTPSEFSKIQEIVTIHDPLSAIFIIGVVVIIAPFIEELIFRGFFQRILEFRIRDITKAVLYSALTFAIIHFNPWWTVQIYIIGIFMGYVAWRTNSIWISFILHAFNNGAAVLFNHLPEKSLQIYEWHGHVSPVFLLTGGILLAVGLFWFTRIPFVTEDYDLVVPVESLRQNPPES